MGNYAGNAKKKKKRKKKYFNFPQLLSKKPLGDIQFIGVD